MNLQMEVAITTKDDHRYVFRYGIDEEPTILRSMADLASNPNNDFDWLDALALSCQVGMLSQQARQHKKKRDGDE